MVTHLIADGRWYPWADVETLDPRPRLRTVEPAAPVRHSLLLDRHVLDSQIVDLAGKRVRRVGDVELAEDAGRLRLVAVDVGAAALLRRLGLRRAAGRARRQPIDWRSLHVISRPAHGLQLDSPASAVHRLSDAELVDQLPPIHAREVLARRGAAAPARPPRRSRFPLRLIRRRAP